MYPHQSLHWLPVILIIVAFFLSACQPPTPTAAPAVPPAQAEAQAVVEPTVTAATVATATYTVPAPTALISTATPAQPTKTPKPELPAITLLPGMVMYTHSEIRDHVFQVDPAEWMLDPYRYNDLEMNFLRHRTLTNCRIVPTIGRGGGGAEISVILGLYTWRIMYYGPGNPYQPASGGPVNITFYNYTKQDCQKAINTVLKNLVHDENAAQKPQYQHYQPPALTATLVRMDCGIAYLRISDRVKIVTDAVWLRSAPNKDAASKVVRLTKEKDWQIEITGGPECGGDTTGRMVFWQVRVNLPGEAEQTGWLAEGDGYEPFLAVIE